MNSGQIKLKGQDSGLEGTNSCCIFDELNVARSDSLSEPEFYGQNDAEIEVVNDIRK